MGCGEGGQKGKEDAEGDGGERATLEVISSGLVICQAFSDGVLGFSTHVMHLEILTI